MALAKVNPFLHPYPTGEANVATAPQAATSKTSLLDTNTVKEALGPEKKKITLKLKKPVPKPSIAGNWKESDVTS